jgi:hypothetical protein
MKLRPKDPTGASGSKDAFSMAQHRKRQKTTATTCISDEAEASSKVKRTRGRRGILKELTEMPLDVLFEVRMLTTLHDRIMIFL